MELQNARQIIETLAQGIHPVTGEVMPEDSPYNAPPVIRALFAVAQALEAQAPAARATRRGTPPINAGKPWGDAEDSKLIVDFENGVDLTTIARDLGRTRFGVEQRLIKLGKIAPPTAAALAGAR